MSTKFSIASVVVVCAAVTLAPSCLAQYQIGDRVQVNGDYGTVIKFGPPIYGGGNQIFVHLDKLGTQFPETGIMVDWKNSPNVKKAGADAPPAPTAPANNAAGGNAGGGAAGGGITGGGHPGGGAGGGNAGGGAGGGNTNHAVGGANPGGGANQGAGANQGGGTNQAAGGDIQVPKNAPPNAETFKNVLRARIPQPGWGDTITLDFQYFNLSGPMQHAVRYEGHLNQETILGGPGRGVQAWKANTKFIQRTHFKDIHADDQWFTKTGDYWFYKDPAGYWVSEDENVQLGTTQYVHKG